jgi:hypothetical protein
MWKMTENDRGRGFHLEIMEQELVVRVSYKCQF